MADAMKSPGQDVNEKAADELGGIEGHGFVAVGSLDLGVCHILLSEFDPELVDDPERPRTYNAVMHSEYARLAGMSPAALTAAMEPYLPMSTSSPASRGCGVPSGSG
jgi:hypothetical protein